MKKTLTVMTMVIALAMSTMAGAFASGHDEGQELGRQGNNACYGISGVGGMEFENPGAMFRYIQDEKDMGPAEWIENRQAETVGQFIYFRCVYHNDDAN